LKRSIRNIVLAGTLLASCGEDLPNPEILSAQAVRTQKENADADRVLLSNAFVEEQAYGKVTVSTALKMTSTVNSLSELRVKEVVMPKVFFDNSMFLTKDYQCVAEIVVDEEDTGRTTARLGIVGKIEDVRDPDVDYSLIIHDALDTQGQVSAEPIEISVEETHVRAIAHIVTTACDFFRDVFQQQQGK